MNVRRTVAVAAIGVVALVLGGCRTTSEVQTVTAPITVPCGSGGTTVSARWTVPTTGNRNGVVYLQHGFARSASKVDDLARSIAARGLVVVAPDLSSFGGCAINAASTRDAVADLVDGQGTDHLQASADQALTVAGLPAATLPSRVVLAGHSAGGALATAVGGRLAASPSADVRARLAGVVLLDPVETTDGAMAAAMPALAATSVLTVSAPGGSCNDGGSGTGVLTSQRAGFVGVRLPSGCHCDAEADSTDFLCTLVCGSPSTEDEAVLKRLAADWADDMARGRRVDTQVYPGGEWYEDQLGAGRLVSLDG